MVAAGSSRCAAHRRSNSISCSGVSTSSASRSASVRLSHSGHRQCGPFGGGKFEQRRKRRDRHDAILSLLGCEGKALIDRPIESCTARLDRLKEVGEA